MKKWIRPTLVLAAIVVVVLVLRATIFAPESVDVTVVAVARGRVEQTVTNSRAGTIEARRRAKLSTGTSGVVVQLEVSRGQRVTAGDVLLRLEDSTQSAELELAMRALDVAMTSHSKTCIAAERARRELERNRKLAADNVVSIDVLDALESAELLAIAECDVAAAEVERSRAAIAVARAEHAKTVLRAPYDAIIAEVSVEVGEWVTPSVPLLAAPDLIDAIDPSSLYVSAPMDEVDAGRLATGQRVRVTIDPYPDRSFTGRVARVAPFVLDIEQQNRTLEIEVELDDREFSATLLPGTSADVEVVLSQKEDVLRVPAYALIEGSRVFVVENERITIRAVTTGLRNWDWVEITDGLEEGDRVITSLDRPEVVVGARVAAENAER